jgi:hypothetical protein
MPKGLVNITQLVLELGLEGGWFETLCLSTSILQLNLNINQGRVLKTRRGMVLI